jgi:hypothetical protein
MSTRSSLYKVDWKSNPNLNSLTILNEKLSKGRSGILKKLGCFEDRLKKISHA